MAGGRVEAGLQVAAVARHTERLAGSPLVLLLDFLLALEAHRVLGHVGYD